MNINPRMDFSNKLMDARVSQTEQSLTNNAKQRCMGI